jgi:acetyl-CoA C-acetyltransferase
MDCGIAGGTDTSSDVPIELSIPFSQKLVQMTKERNLLGRLGTFQGLGPKDLLPRIPGVKEPRTGLSMGEHCELMAQEWNISRQEQDELALQSHKRAAIAWENGFYNDLVGAYLGAQKDNNIRPDATIEGFKKLRPAFEQSAKGTLTAGNSSPLTDGAAAVLLGTDAWAKEAGLEPLAYLTHYQSAAINYNGEEGLLMAPAYAVSSMLTRAKLSLQDFDFYEIHEAFAAQVLCTLKAWNDDKFCRQRLGREGRLGDIDFSKLNVKGGSIAIGHPFAATGARILASAGKMLKEKGKGRALISICTAGGMGITAILER